MSSYEYKTVALPRAVVTRRRRRQSEADLVAEQLGKVLNDEAIDGWEYLRAETLTTPGRGGMFQKGVPAAYIVLVFRRVRAMAWARAAATANQSQADQQAREEALARPAASSPPRQPQVRPPEQAPTPSAAPSATPDLRIASTSGQLVSRVDTELPGESASITPFAPRHPAGPGN